MIAPADTAVPRLKARYLEEVRAQLQSDLGLDNAVEKSIKLGFDGFDSASSANISPQTANGDEHGTLTITGQVDQGASANKGMRLRVGMVAYNDGPLEIQYEGDTIDEEALKALVTAAKSYAIGSSSHSAWMTRTSRETARLPRSRRRATSGDRAAWSRSARSQSRSIRTISTSSMPRRGPA
jgi:aryl-alcohol dehydrogenase-like predicted oxidoreductase